MKLISITKIILLLATSASLLLSSCVSTKNVKLTMEQKAGLRGKKVVVTQRAMPEHAVLKQSAMAGAMLAGPLGGAIAGSMAANEGATQIKRHNISDPTHAVKNATANDLKKKTGCLITQANNTTNGLDVKKTIQENSSSDYILDVMTTTWMGMYYPMSFGKYFLTYGSKMNLIETKTGKIVAEGFYIYQGNDRDKAPDYDGIYTNGAAFLKAETKKGTGGAIYQFTSQF